MSLRTGFLVASAWAVSLVGVGLWAADVAKRPGEMKVVSGDNLGIRLEGRQGEVRLGTLVVRVDGEWVEVQLAPKLTHAKP
jgi:hypothetical protein